jgi:hypothetical protein
MAGPAGNGKVTWHRELELESVRLMPGAHRSPREGICAVELASLLAGERFSDHPACVCKVIAAFMRSLNDRLGHRDRQRLIPYVQRAVDSRGGRELTRRRYEICLAAAGVAVQGGPLRRGLSRLTLRGRIFALFGLRHAMRIHEGAGEYAARVLFARQGTEAAFAVLDRLLEAAPLAHPVQRPPGERVAAAVRELAGEAQVSDHESAGKRANHNGHPGHLGGRYARQADEEDVEHDRARNSDPEGETKSAEEPHRVPSLP